jgi:tRNA(Ile)-lysidine synthase
MQSKDLIGELRRVLHDAQIARDAGLLLAVSGGRDSMAMVKALVLLNRTSAQPWRLHGVVVNHGLRPEAAKEARFVRDTLSQWGVPCEVVKLQPPNHMDRGALAWARDARYAALETVRRALGLRYVATAHHLDDLAETMVLRLIRGASPASLASMKRAQGALLRPLLGVRRSDIDRFVKKHGVPYVDDPTNQDAAHPRTRVRQEVMPLLEALGGDAVADRLAALSVDLAEDEAALSALVPRSRARTLSMRKLAAMAPALRRRVVWQWLQSVAPASQLARAHLRACLTLGPGASVRLPGGAIVVCKRGRLTLE